MWENSSLIWKRKFTFYTGILTEREEMELLVKWRKSDTSCKCIVISYTSSQCIEIQYILRNRITSDISSKCVETCKKMTISLFRNKRGLMKYLMKCPSERIQNMPYFTMYNHVVFSLFNFVLHMYVFFP